MCQKVWNERIFETRDIVAHFCRGRCGNTVDELTKLFTDKYAAYHTPYAAHRPEGQEAIAEHVQMYLATGDLQDYMLSAAPIFLAIN